MATVEARNLVSTPNDDIEALMLVYEIWRTDVEPAESLLVVDDGFGNPVPGTYNQSVSYSAIQGYLDDGFTGVEATDMAIADAVNAKLAAEMPQEPEVQPVGMTTPSLPTVVHDPDTGKKNSALRTLKGPFTGALSSGNCARMREILDEATEALGAEHPEVVAREVNYVSAGCDLE